MRFRFLGHELEIHPTAPRHKTEEDIEETLRTCFRMDHESVHNRADVLAVAGWDSKRLPTVVLINTRIGVIFHANPLRRVHVHVPVVAVGPAPSCGGCVGERKRA